MCKNRLYFGDNLEVLRRHIKDETIDLIYLDPPFKSGKSYNVLFEEKNGSKSRAQIKAFEDTWYWDRTADETYREIMKNPECPIPLRDMLKGLRDFLRESEVMSYLVMMAIRLVELHRVLKPTGSIYLHCDPAASHYLKLLLDATFGARNFRNEVIWKRTSSHSDAKRYGRVHDVILYYSRGDSSIWNCTYQPYDEAYVRQYYRFEDPDGRRWMSDNLSASGLSGGGYEYEWKGVTRVWRCPQSKMEELDRAGRIYYTRKGVARLKRYLDESKGLPVLDVWADLEALRSWHKERLGYPTQKPESLLERIILASSKENDTVLDPFCGCGTTVVVAERLNRKWIGIDITHLAMTLIKHRLADAFGAELSDYEVIGEPVDLRGADVLARQDRFQFQFWALGLIGARPSSAQEKRGPDRGIDGKLYFMDEKDKTKTILIQVKSGHVTSRDVRDFRGTIERQAAPIGVFITLKDPSREMTKEALTAGYYESPWNHKPYPRIQILTIEGLLTGKKIECPGLLRMTKEGRRSPKDKGEQIGIQGI